MGWDKWKEEGKEEKKDDGWGYGGGHRDSWGKESKDSQSWSNGSKRGYTDDWSSGGDWSKRGRWEAETKQEETVDQSWQTSQASNSGRIPQTPGDGGAPQGRIPQTPAAHGFAGMQSPSTPAQALQGQRVPSTPADAFRGMAAPSTPFAAFGGVPMTPGMNRMPGTPGMQQGFGGAPATPAGRHPGTPGYRNPSTPAGLPMTPGGNPGTPAGPNAFAPSTPGGARYGSMQAAGQQQRSFSGLNTPTGVMQRAPMEMVSFVDPRSRPIVPVFSDGRACTLRHAPRRKKGVGGERVPAPMTPASFPNHWNNPAAGTAPKPTVHAEKDAVPDFKTWTQIQKTDGPRIIAANRLAAARLASAPDTDTPVPMLPSDPGTPGFTPGLQAPEYGTMTPFLEGGMTPMLPPSGMRGDDTPFLGETPRLGGEDTPQVPFMGHQKLPPGSTPLMDVGALYGGEQTPLAGHTPMPSGAETPIPGAWSSKDEQVSGSHHGTPSQMAQVVSPGGLEVQGGMTPSFLPGMETPMLGGGAGDETPFMPTIPDSGLNFGSMTPAVGP